MSPRAPPEARTLRKRGKHPGCRGLSRGARSRISSRSSQQRCEGRDIGRRGSHRAHGPMAWGAPPGAANAGRSPTLTRQARAGNCPAWPEGACGSSVAKRRDGASRRPRGRAPGPPLIACARRSSISSGKGSTASASSISMRARERWRWKRSPAARRRRCSSSGIAKQRGSAAKTPRRWASGRGSR